MKCLVTGGTGFLGINLVRELVASGWDVTAAGFTGHGFRYFRDLPLQAIRLDVTDASQVDGAVRGHDVVFHVAGDTSFWWRRFEQQRRVNVDGTIHVVRACIRHGVQRLVYTSTNDVLPAESDGRSAVESDHRGFRFHNLRYNYGETKWEAERELRKLVAQRGIDVVTLYPGFMIGPWDHSLQLGRLFFDLQKRGIPGFIPGGGSYCHVTEVARAHIAAATRGRPGEGYVVAGSSSTNLPHRRVWELMAEAVNAPPPRRTLAPWMLLAWAWICVGIAEWTRRHPQIDPGMARYLMSHHYSRSDKAVRDLGYQVPPVEGAIRDAVSWYRSHGFLPPAVSADQPQQCPNAGFDQPTSHRPVAGGA